MKCRLCGMVGILDLRDHLEDYHQVSVEKQLDDLEEWHFEQPSISSFTEVSDP